MEASEDHDDTFFFLMIGCVTYGNNGLCSTAHMCAYIYAKATYLSICTVSGKKSSQRWHAAT